MYKFLVSIFLLINISTLYAQKNGVVVDSKNQPLKKVSILFLDQNILVYSDEKGKFVINKNIPNNSYIHFFKHGYASQIYKYKSDLELRIVLEKLHVTLDEIGVSESVYELGNSKLVNIEKKSLSSLQSNSMVEDVSELSGVDMISSGMGIQKIVIRGLSGMRVVTFLNGMQINNQQWANDHGIGFTDLGLSEVELIKGASALKYGSESIGGLLYFKDDPFISSEKLNGFVSSRFNNSSYLNSSKFGIKWNRKNFYVNLYGQYSISTDYRLPNNTYLNNSRFQQNAVKFSLAHTHNNWQNIFRYHLHEEATGIPGHVHTTDLKGVDILKITSPSLDFSTDFKPYRPTQFIKNQLFIYESNYMINNLKFDFYAGHFINNLEEYEKWGKPAFSLNLANTILHPNIRYLFNYFNLNLGSQIILQQNKNNEKYRLVPDASSLNFGPYLLIEYEKDNIGINTGVRFDNKNLKTDDPVLNIDYENTFSNTSFSSGIYYKHLDHIFRLTYSGAHRTPHFSELFSEGVHHGTNRYEIGDRNLTIEYANQIDFKYQWSNEHFGIVFNPFIQDISDFISIEPTDSVASGYKVYKYRQYKRININGVEMNIHYHPHQLHNLHLEQSYSFLQAKNNDSEYGLALIPANSIKSKVLFSFNEYKKITKYKFDYVSLSHMHKFKQDYYAEYEEATNAYNILKLQIGLKFSSQFYCALTLNNLFNETYTPHVSRLRGVAGGVPNPGRFIDINLKYEF